MWRIPLSLRNRGFWRIADAGEDECVSPAPVCGKSLACCGCLSSCPLFCSRLISVLLALSASCSSPPFCSSSSLETCLSVSEWKTLMKLCVSYLISKIFLVWLAVWNMCLFFLAGYRYCLRNFKSNILCGGLYYSPPIFKWRALSVVK